MTLKEKFTNYYGKDSDEVNDEKAEQFAIIADEYAIEFLNWYGGLRLDQVNNKTTKELLEIFKKRTMTLKEQFTFNCRECDTEENAETSVKIADEHAVSFGIWLSVNCEQSNSRDAWWIYESDWKTTDELLKIFKKEKGL